MAPRKGPILVVDDDPDVAEALQDALDDEGYTVAVATNGQAALAYLANQDAALVILDWMMPVLDGAGFLAAVGENPTLAELPIVLLSADASAGKKAQGHPLAGALAKPVKLDLLFTYIERYVAL